MRKLTVKNFSVIKDAELEFGKITVLIGPQSSGKSLLCKLAYFFQVVVPEVAEESIRKVHTLESFRLAVADEFVNGWFPLFGPEPAGEVHYDDNQNYKVSVHYSYSGTFSSGLAKSIVQLSPKIESVYEDSFEIVSKKDAFYQTAEISVYGRSLRENLQKLQSKNTEVFSYIPATRSFFVTLQRAVMGTSERDDHFTRRFANDFSFDFARRVPKAGGESELTHWIDDESQRILRGGVVVEGNIVTFQTEDGRVHPISFLSSGSQELLPLMTLLREYVALSAAISKALDLPQAIHKRLFFLEEPEANNFPDTQHELAKIFSRMANEPTLDASWVITTHSPYILSSFNDLIQAGIVGADGELRAEVNEIIPEKYWVSPNDFKAYSIHGGKLNSIMDEETGLINGEYLDAISNKIGGDFDALLRIGYAKSST